MATGSNLQNYNVYFPIQLWESRTGSYRLQPPRLGQRDSYLFLPVFWQNMRITDPHRKEELTDQWSIKTTFWAGNPKYHYLFNRGFVTLTMVQNPVFPFETRKIEILNSPVTLFQDEIDWQNIFGFSAYTVPVPTTVLLYVNNDERSQTLVLRYCEDRTKGCAPDPLYPFLPSLSTKNLSCYELFNQKNAIYLYVFPNEPRGQYFRLTSENICVPSTSPRDFWCLSDCVKASVAPRFNTNDITIQSSPDALQTAMYTYPKPQGHDLFFVFRQFLPCFGVFFLVLLVVLLCATRRRFFSID